MARSLHLLGTHSAKTIKGEARGHFTGILYLSPFTKSGHCVCPDATPGCIKSCLDTAGRGRMKGTQAGRIRKTTLFCEDRELFLSQLDWDIRSIIRRAAKRDMMPAVRLNGTSDIAWEDMVDMQSYDCQFYDYTKSPKRMLKFLQGNMPRNYDLTMSLSEKNQAIAEHILDIGGRVAPVFDKVPKKWLGYDVADGDIDDLIFTRKGLVGLTAKGEAIHDETGFVNRTRKVKFR